ncbi:MAG: CocE/NonD family hydrolase [Pirellulales bacterium]
MSLDRCFQTRWGFLPASGFMAIAAGPAALVSSCLILLVLVAPASAQSKFRGIPPEHRKYVLADGVTERDVTYYSDGTACFARLFFPKDFSTEHKTPGVVVSQGWAGISETIVKYGNRFAERGLVAMCIDYRGWGNSDGFVSMIDRVTTADEQRITELPTKVRITRTRLLPMKQVDDIRSAISYLQGEPGVDAKRIGLWGSSYAGGHVLAVAACDPRVRAIVSQVSGINGYNSPEGPLPMSEAEIADAVNRARSGQGAEFKTGFSQPRYVDVETQRAAKEYRPLHLVKHISDDVAVLFLLAGKEELINNDRAGKAAYEQIKGPKKLVVYPDIGHFDIYIEENFERASNEAADWFVKHLGLHP